MICSSQSLFHASFNRSAAEAASYGTTIKARVGKTSAQFQWSISVLNFYECSNVTIATTPLTPYSCNKLPHKMTLPNTCSVQSLFRALLKRLVAESGRNDTTSKGHVVEILGQEQLDEFLKRETVTLVDFWAPYCGYCTKMAPAVSDSLRRRASLRQLSVSPAASFFFIGTS